MENFYEWFDSYLIESLLYRYENNGTYTKIPVPMFDDYGNGGYYADHFGYFGDTYLAFYGYTDSSMRRSYDLNQYTLDVFSNDQYGNYGRETFIETADNIYLIFKIDLYSKYVIFQERDIE